jgi:predicted alpha/beta hydrolase family esterase
MRAAEADILIVPGWGGSGPDHWQTRWQDKLSTARRVEQEDWERPDLEAWTARIVSEVAKAERPVVLVGHSLGVTAVVHAAQRLPQGMVKGAFLVAPPSAAFLQTVDVIDPAFRKIPESPLPFPSLLVVSANDVHCTQDEAERLGRAWGCSLAQAGEAGHINADSGHGPWPEGLVHFAGFISRL